MKKLIPLAVVLATVMLAAVCAHASGAETPDSVCVSDLPGISHVLISSGGGRNDIESMRRAVPIHKTDHDYTNTADKQAMHQALFAWFPYFGTNLTGSVVDEYIMRTNYTPWVNLNLNINSEILKWSTVSSAMYEWQTVSKYYYCDYYELTQWGEGDGCWRGWQFIDPVSGEGFIQMFRPKDAKDGSYRIRLKGLDAELNYDMRNADTGVTYTAAGTALMRDGFDAELPPHSTVLYTIKPAG